MKSVTCHGTAMKAPRWCWCPCTNFLSGEQSLRQSAGVSFHPYTLHAICACLKAAVWICLFLSVCMSVCIGACLCVSMSIPDKGLGCLDWTSQKAPHGEEMGDTLQNSLTEFCTDPDNKQYHKNHGLSSNICMVCSTFVADWYSFTRPLLSHFLVLENLIIIYIQTHLYYSKLGHGRHRQYYHNAHTNRHALFWVWAWKAHVMVWIKMPPLGS